MTTSIRRGDAFDVLRIAQLCQDLRVGLERLEVLLPESLPPLTGIPLSDEAVTHVDAAAIGDIDLQADGLLQAATELHRLTALPPRGISVSRTSLADAAALQLAAGLTDIEAVFAAASVLTVDQGWPALAHSLRLKRAPYRRWGTASPEEVISAFQGTEGAVVRSVLGQASISSGTGFARCGAQTVRRLADALDSYSAPAA
jgi:hypothetical protein